MGETIVEGSTLMADMNRGLSPLRLGRCLVEAGAVPHWCRRAAVVVRANGNPLLTLELVVPAKVASNHGVEPSTLVDLARAAETGGEPERIALAAGYGLVAPVWAVVEIAVKDKATDYHVYAESLLTPQLADALARGLAAAVAARAQSEVAHG